jgi:threonine dehydratase
MIDKQKITDAHERIKPYINRTPVLTSEALDELTGCNIFFKCENLQKIGAFKMRGAMNAALSLPKYQRVNGIATHSSGNHAQAIARAAKVLGIKSFIVMPRNAPDIKKNGVRELGGEIFECEPTLQARESTLAEVVAKTGAVEIHPFNNYDVITGQATAAKEFFEDQPSLDFLLAPVGGGGLLSGVSLAAKYFCPNTAVIAAEPEGADDAFRSLQMGSIQPSQSNSIADGLLTTLGDKTYPIIRDNVREVITVSDAEIVDAMRVIWQRLKMIVEPSGAVPMAAILKKKDLFRGKKVGVIFSGGNVDLARAFEMMLKK